MSPKELVEYADRTMLVLKKVADAGPVFTDVQLQGLQLTVDSARLAVELARVKLDLGPRPRWVS